jgi:hypothetical protein
VPHNQRLVFASLPFDMAGSISPCPKALLVTCENRVTYKLKLIDSDAARSLGPEVMLSAEWSSMNCLTQGVRCGQGVRWCILPWLGAFLCADPEMRAACVPAACHGDFKDRRNILMLRPVAGAAEWRSLSANARIRDPARHPDRSRFTFQAKPLLPAISHRATAEGRGLRGSPARWRHLPCVSPPR